MIKNPEIAEELNWLNCQEDISYEELMKFNGDILRKAKKLSHENKEVESLLSEIKKRALKVSIKKIANGEPLYHLYITINYPAIERASRFIYPRTFEKTSLQQLIEDSGEIYYQRHKFRNFREFIEDIRAYGNSIETLNHDLFYTRDQGLGRAIKNRFGTIGKAVILSGVDYTKTDNSMTKRSKYKFSREELFDILEDKSLDESMKTMCLFNSISMKYYNLEELMISQDPDRIMESTNIDLPINSIRLNMKQYQNENKKLSSVELSISSDIDNPFNQYSFLFSGNNREGDSLRLYYELDRTLYNLGLNII
ncbi:MAG: hypothetical protein WC867_01965 [Candidatus Pacearchaeota archaeon]|jgi:hypothetical protein